MVLACTVVYLLFAGWFGYCPLLPRQGDIHDENLPPLRDVDL